MAYLIDDCGNVIGTANTNATRILVANALSSEGTPVNAFRVRVSTSKAAAAKAKRAEYLPRYECSTHDVFVRSDVLSNHETVVDRNRRLLNEQRVKESAAREVAVEYIARRKESFAAEIAAGLED